MSRVLKVLGVFCLLLLSIISFSQVNNYTIAESSNMVIEGTSNVRDWGIDVDEIEGKIQMSDSTIEAIEFSVLTETFKGQVGGMGKHIKKAIKQEEYPELSFKLKEVESFDGENAIINGALTVAGVSQLIKVEGKVVKADNGFEISGEKLLKMTDFDIKPPKAMFGTIKAADDIKVIFNINLVN
jgi:polyisoprenoid-binding protein YceI